MSTAAGTKRALRDRPLFRVAIVVVLLAAALLASRSCAGGANRVSQDEAVEIAKEQIAYEPNRVHVRFFRRGIPAVGTWAVSLSLVKNGVVERQTLVVVGAGDGKVIQIQDQEP